MSNIPKGYKQTEVGIIPDDWEVNTIASTTPRNVKNGIVDGPFGSNLKTIHYRKSGIPIITSGYVTEGIFFATDYLYVDVEKFKQEKRSAVRAGDIVMAKIGARCGASAILPALHETGILSGNALKITVDDKRHSTYYIWQVLWYLYATGNIEALKTVGAQPAISMQNLKKYKIPLPSLHEQTAIATALSDADALISRLEALIAKKRNIKQGAMQELLTGKKRLPGFSGEWEVKKLGKIVNFSNGKAHEKFISDSGKYIVVNSKFISSEGEVIKYSDQCLCPVSIDEILMVMSDVPNGKAIAKCFLVDGNEKYTVNQRICSLKAIDVDSKLLFYKLNRNPYYLAFDDGVKQTNLRKEDVLSCELNIPKVKAEQTAIAQILSDMDAEIEQLEQKRDKYRMIKQGMMQELLTGKTRLI